MPAKYTEVEGRRFKQTPFLHENIPPCQHDRCRELGEFDSPTRWGPWADLCLEHVKTDAPPNITIGYHRVTYIP